MLRAATLESRLEELGVVRSFSRPRVSNDNPYSESLFRTANYWPDYPSRPFAIKFVTPQQRHSGQAVEICRHRAVVNKRWPGSIRQHQKSNLNQLRL